MVPVTVPVVASVVEPCDREAAVMRRDDLALQGSAAGEHVLVRRGEGHFVYIWCCGIIAQ